MKLYLSKIKPAPRYSQRKEVYPHHIFDMIAGTNEPRGHSYIDRDNKGHLPTGYRDVLFSGIMSYPSLQRSVIYI